MPWRCDTVYARVGFKEKVVFGDDLGIVVFGGDLKLYIHTFHYHIVSHVIDVI